MNNIFTRYAKKTASTLEQKRVESYFEQAQLGGMSAAEAEKDVQLKQRMAMAIHKKIAKRRVRMMWQYSAAAMLAIAVLFTGIHKISEENIYNVEICTAQGEQQTVWLSDSSQVILSAESKIIYPSKFKGKTREIQLEGKAFFHVKPDASKPFIVYTADLQTEVLGTSFTVSNYAGETAEVVVCTGKVRVSADEQEEILTKDMQVQLREGKLKRTNTNAERYSNWMNQAVYFDQSSLAEVARELERKFSVRLIYSPKDMADLTISGSFQGEDITQLLQSLCFICNLEFQWKGDKTFELKRK
ncbi:MAG: FecR family protein [Mangrovibacterium sp.]